MTAALVAFTLGQNTVSAELVFNAAGELVDFVCDDRGALGKDGTLRYQRWSTPMSSYADFGGWRLANEGEAIWHRPEGSFVYGRLRLTEYEARWWNDIPPKRRATDWMPQHGQRHFPRSEDEAPFHCPDHLHCAACLGSGHRRRPSDECHAG